MFWEQFEVSIYSKTHFTNGEKLENIRHALKEGPANEAIDGLLQSADQCEEAIGVSTDLPNTSSACLCHPRSPFRERRQRQGSTLPTRRR